MKTLVTVAYHNKRNNNFAITAVNREKSTLDHEFFVPPLPNGQPDWGAVAAEAVKVANNWTRIGEGWFIVGPERMLDYIPSEFRYVSEKRR